MELQKQLQALSNTKQWQKQLQILQSLPLSQELVSHLNTGKQAQILSQMLLNPRTKVLTTTVEFLLELFERYGPVLHSFLFHTLPTMLKLLNSSNRIISSTIHQLLKCVVMCAPHEKMYQIFSQQFSSKNGYVREQLSSYFMVLLDTVGYPMSFRNSLEKWKQDPNQYVRQNIKAIISCLEEDRSFPLKEKKQNRKVRQMSVKVKAPHTHKSSILNSFCIENQHPEVADIEFLLHKIHNNEETWSVKMTAIEELFRIVKSEGTHEGCWNDVMDVVVSLLEQRRSKVYERAYEVFKLMARCESMGKPYLIANIENITLKILKTEKFVMDYLPVLLHLDPIKHLILFTQLSVEVKPLKQKVLLLDGLATGFCEYSFEEGKVSIVCKLLCKHIERHSNQKDIYLPCLAIISQFKSTFPETLLGCLLCQDNSILTKIIKIAEEIDPQLRDGIIEYIHKMKGTKSSESRKIVKVQQVSEDRHLSKIKQIIGEIEQNKDIPISTLAQYTFYNFTEFTPVHFVTIIKLSESLIDESQLLDLEIMLGQLCKAHSSAYIQGLFRCVQACDEKTIESQYILVYLQKIDSILITTPQFRSQKTIQRLINMYRTSRNAKIRKSCIKLLCGFDPELFSFLSGKQRELIKFYQSQGGKSVATSLQQSSSL